MLCGVLINKITYGTIRMDSVFFEGVKMKKFALILFATVGLLASASFAQDLVLGATDPWAEADYGLEVGTRQQSGDADGGQSTKSQMAMQFGATANFPLSTTWHLRTGMLFTPRPLTVETGTGNNKVTINYLDIPVALMYKFEESAGVFFGISLGLNLDKSADVGTVTDVKSPLTPFLLGASFKFMPNLGLALYYESASGEVAKGLKDYRAVGANLMITFD